MAGLVFFGLLGRWLGHRRVDEPQQRAGPGAVDLGEDTFNMGSAKDRAQEVADRGPLLFPGLIAADEGYIVVNHIGTDELAGWKAFAAVPPGSRIECAVMWQAGAQQFQDPCTGASYPADGKGLTAYRVEISPDQELVIDLGRGRTTVP